MTSPLLKTFTDMRPAGGFKVVLADPPWAFENYSAKGEAKNPNQHYECQDLDWICSLPVQALAADDCALFLWCTWPLMPVWDRVLEAWGFRYGGLAWEWIKFNEQTGKYAFGCGYGTRKNLEPCILAVKGAPKLRKPEAFFGNSVAAQSHSVRDFLFHWPLDAMRSAQREHSRKPEEQYGRIETMFDGPYVELFARTTKHGWASWGSQVDRFGEVA